MGSTKEQRRARKLDELCNYCYANRVAFALHRDRIGVSVFLGFEAVKESYADCTCSPSQSCRDSTCAYFKFGQE